MKKLKLVLSLLVLLVLATPIAAFWRLLCHGQLGVVRIDPLTDYGLVSDHAHAVHGADGFSFTSNADDLMKSNCTSCSVTQDHSVYWTPPLYFHFDNGTFQLIAQSGGMTAYYFNDNAPGENITAFPNGFSMISGDARQRNATIEIEADNTDKLMSFWNASDTTQLALSQKAIGFNCLNYTDGFATEGSLMFHFIQNRTFMDAQCLDGLRLELMFPSCWDGKNLDSENHKSHVQFPEFVKTGSCPEGFKVRLPVLFYETIFDIHAYANYSGQYVLSNGDATGWGYHGDYIAAWDEGVLDSAVNTCTNMSGLQEDCPIFDIQSDENATSCVLTLPEILQDDDVHGPMTCLPGNHPIYPSGPYAPACTGTPIPGFAAASRGSISAYISSASSAVTYPSLVVNASSLAITTAPPISSDASPDVLPGPSTTTFTSNNSEIVMVVMVQEVTVTASATDSGMKRHIARHGHHHV